MGYVIRLSDGRFLLLDGGIGEYDETERFYRYLTEQTTGRPVIAGWFFSHAHPDHINLFCRFVEQFADKVEIQEVFWRWPSAENYPGLQYCPVECFDAAIQRLKGMGTRLTTLETGQTFSFPDCSIDVIFTEADLLPGVIPNLNESSSVFRMTLNGKVILWLGDVVNLGASFICKRYAPEYLKCDVVQVGHHGYFGASDELYRLADPTILLWPCPDYWFHVVRLWQTNQYLISSPKITHTLVSGQGRYTIDFPEMTVTGKTRQPEGQELLYHADFSEKSIMKLGWSCLRGGKTQYVPAAASFPEGRGIRLTETSGSNCVCAILRPDEVKNEQKIALTLKIENAGEDSAVGFLWDSLIPTVWAEERVLWAPLKKGETQTLRVTIDCRNHVAVLKKGDDEVTEYRCFENVIFGIHLCLRNADMIIHSISVSREP